MQRLVGPFRVSFPASAPGASTPMPPLPPRVCAAFSEECGGVARTWALGLVGRGGAPSNHRWSSGGGGCAWSTLCGLLLWPPAGVLGEHQAGRLWEYPAAGRVPLRLVTRSLPGSAAGLGLWERGWVTSARAVGVSGGGISLRPVPCEILPTLDGSLHREAVCVTAVIPTLRRTMLRHRGGSGTPATNVA